MKNRLIVLFMVCAMLSLKAQDTLSLSCPDTVAQLIKLKPGYRTLFVKGTQTCDSIYLLSGNHYQILQRKLKASQSFVQLYKFYRDEVKKGDREVSAIVDGYEVIIKTKDDAYNRLMDEYTVLNHLLDTSISQTGAAVDISRKSLSNLEKSLDGISETNERLRTDLKDLQRINRNNKWKFGIGGFALGLLAGFLIAN